MDGEIRQSWEALARIDDETVIENEACDVCVMFRDILENPPVETMRCYRFKLTDAWTNSKTCWFCRYLCRICTRFLSRNQLDSCWAEQGVIDVYLNYGKWEKQLSIGREENVLASSHGLAVAEFKASEDAIANNDSPLLRLYESNDPAPLREVYHALIYTDSSKEIRKDSFELHDVFLTYDSYDDQCRRRLQKRIEFAPEQKSEYFEMICGWITDCENHHTRCAGAGSQFQSLHGFNVIDVREKKIIQITGSCSYVALSYVWGTVLTPSGDRVDAYELCKDILSLSFAHRRVYEDVPQTIKDAMLIAQSLGFRYLWVDCLCINQVDAQMKLEQIRSMDKIFGNASLTICVLEAENMLSGIPGISKPHSETSQIIAQTRNGYHMATWIHPTFSRLNSCSWAHRAWTLQEGVLSRRNLCFDEFGTFLLCREEVFYDLVFHEHSRGQQPLKPDFSLYPTVPLGFDTTFKTWDFGFYARLVTSYCRRKIKYQADAHHAINGILTHFNRVLNLTFHAGLPVEEISNGLLWLHSSTRQSLDELDSYSPRRRDFPSWSWLGWQTPVIYYFWLEKSASRKLLKPEMKNYQERQSYNDADEVFDLVIADELVYQQIVRVLAVPEIQ
ncbi:hypothetical protein LTS08_008332, partial [Lithohypha guttulata]